MKPLKNKTSFYGAYTANSEGYRQFYGEYKQVRRNTPIMEINKIDLDNFETVKKIYKDVIEHMNINKIFQWDEFYPDENTLKNDIVKEEMYAGILNNEIVSLFVLNKEFDEEYLEAQWEYKDNKFIVLHRLCVRTDYQNKGIGNKTMELIESNVKNNGIKSIRLDAFSKNPYSLKMYKKLGYKKVGEANWRKGLFYIYEKII